VFLGERLKPFELFGMILIMTSWSSWMAGCFAAERSRNFPSRKPKGHWSLRGQFITLWLLSRLVVI